LRLQSTSFQTTYEHGEEQNNEDYVRHEVRVGRWCCGGLLAFLRHEHKEQYEEDREDGADETVELGMLSAPRSNTDYDGNDQEDDYYESSVAYAGHSRATVLLCTCD
jgi:hypothetical protein